MSDSTYLQPFSCQMSEDSFFRNDWCFYIKHQPFHVRKYIFAAFPMQMSKDSLLLLNDWCFYVKHRPFHVKKYIFVAFPKPNKWEQFVFAEWLMFLHSLIWHGKGYKYVLSDMKGRFFLCRNINHYTKTNCPYSFGMGKAANMYFLTWKGRCFM